MRARSAAPGELVGKLRAGAINGNVTSLPLRPRRGIAGLYWQMPASWRYERIQLLRRSLPDELVLTLTGGVQ